MMECIILSEDSVEKLEKSINKKLNDGWTLHGYLCLAPIPDQMGGITLRCIQQMIKFTTQKERTIPLKVIEPKIAQEPPKKEQECSIAVVESKPLEEEKEEVPKVEPQSGVGGEPLDITDGTMATKIESTTTENATFVPVPETDIPV
jgi:hypothetical protein